MKHLFQERLADLRDRMCEQEIDTALVTDDDNIFYLTGYYDYLHMEFGRPTIFVVHQQGQSLLITPQIDENSARSLAHCDEIFSWNDGVGDEWREKLPNLIMPLFKNLNELLKTTPKDYILENYKPLESIKAPMAV